MRISAILLAATAALVGSATAAGFELTNVRLAVEQATAAKLPVDGHSNLTGGAAELSYTPGPGLHELVTDEEPLAGPYDGARWELRSSFTKGYNALTLGHYIVDPPLDNPVAVGHFLAGKDRAHSNLAGHRVGHTERVVDGRKGYVWTHGSAAAAGTTRPGSRARSTIRVECIARKEAARFKRLCAEAIGSLEFR